MASQLYAQVLGYFYKTYVDFSKFCFVLILVFYTENLRKLMETRI